MKNLLIPALFTAAFASPLTAAQTSEEFFAEWDLNSDGQVTLLETRTHLGEIFTSFDTNLDGYLDSSDLGENTNEDAPVGSSVGFDDGNGDDRVSMLEFLDNSESFIAMMDKDSDGVITSSDFTGSSE